MHLLTNATCSFVVIEKHLLLQSASLTWMAPSRDVDGCTATIETRYEYLAAILNWKCSYLMFCCVWPSSTTCLRSALRETGPPCETNGSVIGVRAAAQVSKCEWWTRRLKACHKRQKEKPWLSLCASGWQDACISQFTRHCAGISKCFQLPNQDLRSKKASTHTVRKPALAVICNLRHVH